ncbi:hypothetical protein [Salmonirosea aquatica]|uniref:DUF1351 domain-containing protein n=1 Tax=Salmonirosea aquatica TaxID=2654236 RepID=A0A7C9FTC3_9BACT|nr:hypothetical protein [Cytophagaceae bacterium SJW1-29]
MSETLVPERLGIVIPEASAENGLTVINQIERNIALMRENYLGLTILNADDKIGYQAVRRARITVKQARVQVDKARKYLNEDHKQAIERNNNMANAIKIQLEPIEAELQAREDWYEGERARIEREELERKNQKIRDRVQLIMSYKPVFNGVTYELGGFFISHEDVARFDDADFDRELTRLKAEFDILDAQRIENERQAEAQRIQRQQEAEELKAQQAQLRAEREALEKEKLEMQQQRTAPPPPIQVVVFPAAESAEAEDLPEVPLHERQWAQDVQVVEGLISEFHDLCEFLQFQSAPLIEIKSQIDTQMLAWEKQLTVAIKPAARKKYFKSITQ